MNPRRDDLERNRIVTDLSELVEALTPSGEWHRWVRQTKNYGAVFSDHRQDSHGSHGVTCSLAGLERWGYDVARLAPQLVRTNQLPLTPSGDYRIARW